MLRPGTDVIRLQRIDSTNNYAAELLNDGKVTEGTAIMAYDQFGGRGQRGNSWQMFPGEDLSVSYILYPSFKDVAGFVFNKMVTLAVCDTVRFFTGPKVEIKWPNDILYNGLKVGGVLVEVTWHTDKPKHAIVGIGINLAKELYKDLGNIASIGDRYKEVLLEEVFNKLCDSLPFWYHQFQSNSYEEIRLTYRQRLFRNGERVEILTENEPIYGILETVDDLGNLILRTDEGVKILKHGPFRLSMDYPL